MTIDSEVRRSPLYTGTGSVDTYAVGFVFINDADLDVYRTLTGDEEELLVDGSDYNVVGTDIVMTENLASGALMRIIGDEDYLQDIQFSTQENTFMTAFEDGLDRITRLIQQVKAQQDNTIVYSKTFDGDIVSGDDVVEYVALMAGDVQTIVDSDEMAAKLALYARLTGVDTFSGPVSIGGAAPIGIDLYIHTEEGSVVQRLHSDDDTAGVMQLQLYNDIADELSIGKLGSALDMFGVGSGALLNRGGNLNIISDSNDPINFYTDATDAKNLSATLKMQLTAVGLLKIDSIEEFTPDAGVIIEKIEFKDGLMNGNQTLSKYSGDLDAAITAIGAVEVTLTIDVVPDALTQNLVIPENIALRWNKGHVLTGAYDLTVNGGIEAGLYQIFGSALTVKGDIKTVIPQWWGAVGDGDGAGAGTDDSAAIQKMFDYSLVGSAKIDIPQAIYLCDSSLERLITSAVDNKHLIIDGNGSILDFSNLVASGSDIALTIGADSSGTLQPKGSNAIKNLSLYGPEPNNPSAGTLVSPQEPEGTTKGLRLQYAYNVNLDDVYIERFYLGLETQFVFPIKADAVTLQANYIGFYFLDVTTEGLWNRLDCIECRYAGVMRPLYDEGSIGSQIFNTLRLEGNHIGIVIDPNQRGNSAGNPPPQWFIRGIQFNNPYIASNSGDVFRLGKAWTFANPATRPAVGDDSMNVLSDLRINGGHWSYNYSIGSIVPILFDEGPATLPDPVNYTEGSVHGALISVPVNPVHIEGKPRNSIIITSPVQNVSDFDNSDWHEKHYDKNGNVGFEQENSGSASFLFGAASTAVITGGAFSESGAGIGLRLKSNGGPLIGTSVNSAALTAHYQFFNTNNLVGSIATSSSATAFNTSSDYRLKENERPIKNPLELIELLKPYLLNFKAAPDEDCYSFFAHEIAEAIPHAHAVSGLKDAVDKDGKIIIQQIDLTKLIPLLTACIIELFVKLKAIE